MLTFPNNPNIGDTYQSGSSATYQFDGTVWDVVTPPTLTILTATTASYVNTLNQKVVITGSLGIGTSSPTTHLHVVGPSYTSGLSIERTDTNSHWGIAGVTAGGLQFFDRNAGDTTRVVLNASGSVGIGTSSPGAKLHIVGGGAGLTGNGGYFYSYTTSGVIGWGVTGTNTSIYATGDILTSANLFAISDEREKKDIEDISYGLETIMNLRPTEYTKKDYVQHGNRKQLGFIAQEIEQILPEVVSTAEGDVAVMKHWEDFVAEDGVIYNLVIKDKDGEVKWTKGDDIPEGEIFVKSMDVEDKRSVNYDAVIPVLVKAIQELKAEIQALK